MFNNKNKKPSFHLSQCIMGVVLHKHASEIVCSVLLQALYQQGMSSMKSMALGYLACLLMKWWRCW